MYIPSQDNAMKKDCVISKIEASQDGSPYVYVTFSDPNDYKPGTEKPQNPFGASAGFYFPRGFDEKFAKSDVKYF
jgi:hypothetical protein